jgi:hypothetical protein
VKLIFLDWDGVANDHSRHENGYCGAKPECVAQLNRILDAVPDAVIVVTSSWRYLVLSESMTLKGLESVFLTHGLKCYGRLLCVAEADSIGELPHDAMPFQWESGKSSRTTKPSCLSPTNCLICRSRQTKPNASVPNFVQTNGGVGLTESDADRAIKLLTTHPPADSL